MGVPGLWNILRPAKREVSLLCLTMNDGAEEHPEVSTGYRISIDAGIWFYHTTCSRKGENHELQPPFFRLIQLLKLPMRTPSSSLMVRLIRLRARLKLSLHISTKPE
ncbi:hypothetical protein FRB94_002568 [Tulasnella sp. JGI-2019a]|nr:hypothetical protein FRB93_010217 [Tulasnella sp. JGI-2019a]KAG9013493.1 hypothetical protein FRB94_002568 [Tulasnella sp. JGI-2019a]KAG9037307.1 hypothetical protein FRB95_005946 [Tulasnella sp. JGI-2019a]